MTRKKISNRSLIILAVIAAALALLAVAMAINPPAEGDRIYTNMYIHGVLVGGLTDDEAEAALMQQFQPSLDEAAINFTHNGQTVVSRSYKELGVRLDFSLAIQSARDYSNRRNLPARVTRMLGRAHTITEPPEIKVEQTRLDSEIRAVAEKIQTDPVNAGFVYENGQTSVSEESAGLTVDIRHAHVQLSQLIASLEGGNIELQTSPIAPRFTRADLDFTVSTLGSFSTPLVNDDQDPRVRNILRASERIHNQMLYPGDVFSASKLIGSHLPNSGYETAIVLVRGEAVEDIGGGICQVVTTLYKAVLLAELTVVQRHNHSAKVSYAEYGFDATIAGDYFDLKFKNHTSHPILITSQLQSNALYVTIHGNEQRPTNRSLMFSSRRVDIIPPEPYKEVVDTSLEPGDRVVTLESQMGYRYEVYKHIMIDDQEVEQVKINTSAYRPLQGIISVGANGS